MSTTLSEDRRGVKNLHDLSNSTGSSNVEGSSKIPHVNSGSIWKHKPTRIAKPGGNRSLLANPYSSHYNDLNPQGNNTARNVVVPVNANPRRDNTSSMHLDKPPASKKPRRETTGTMRGGRTAHQKLERLAHSMSAKATQEVDSIFSSPSKSHGKTLSKHNKATAPEKSAFHSRDTSTIIDVDADVEDVGERIPPAVSESSDDMLLRPGQDQAESEISQILDLGPPHAHHPFNDVECFTADTLPPTSGPNTTKLKAVLKGSRDDGVSKQSTDSDPIENFDDTEEKRWSSGATQRKRKATPSLTTDFTEGNVRNKALQFEGHSTSQFPKLPQIDLLSHYPRKPNIANSMKTKKMVQELRSSKPVNAPSLEKPPRRRQDDIATAPSDFVIGGKGRKSWPGLKLPIEKWVGGSHVEGLESDSYLWFSVRDDHVFFLRQSTNGDIKPVLKLSLTYDICGLECPRQSKAAGNDDDLNEYPYLGIHVLKTERSEILYKGVERSTKSLILRVKFLKDANWDLRHYKSIIDELSSKRPAYSLLHIDSHARRSQYEIMDREGTLTANDASIPTAKRHPRPRPSYTGYHSHSAEEVSGGSSYTSAEGVRRSSRNMSATSRNPSRPPLYPPDETILLYPPTGTGAVNVTYGDLKRLDPGEYLNDTLIELGLKIWLNDLKDSIPTLAEQVHVFSSFFYTQLNQKNIEEGYQSVRKWTSKFDLFMKRYIIVPINEYMHWYLAIICFPDRALHPPSTKQLVTPNVTTRTKSRESGFKHDSDRIPEFQRPTGMLPPLLTNPTSTPSKSVTLDENEVESLVSGPSHILAKSYPDPPPSPLSTIASGSPKREVKAETDSEGENEPNTAEIAMKVDTPPPRSTSVTASPNIGMVPISTFYGSSVVKAGTASVKNKGRDEKEVDQPDSDSGMDVDDSPPLEPEQLDGPYIFSFDSLGARHPHALKVLTRYLELEAKDKKQLDQTTPPITKQASVPTQPNYCDCGIYLLHFVEQFMSDPEAFTHRIVDHTKSKKSGGVNRQEREVLWNHAMVGNKRETLKEKIEALSFAWKQEREINGKRKEKTEDEHDKVHAEHIAIDNDSDIEVLEVTPEPNKATKVIRLRAPAKQKVQRLR